MSHITAQDVLKQLQLFRRSLPPPTEGDFDMREELLAESRRFLLSLERDHNVVHRVCYQVMETVAISAAMRMGLFAAFKDGPTSIDDIALGCNADPVLVGRLLRCLTAFGAVEETGTSCYDHSTVSRAFTKKDNEAAMIFCLEFLTPSWLCLPSYLEENGWRNPESATITALSKAHVRDGSPKSLFQIMKAAPSRVLEAFNVYMTNFNDGHKSWTEFYPVMERLGREAKQDASAVMMVDVGGGYGHQAAELKHKFQQLPGRFVVQDLVQGLPASPKDGIEYMEHDFFAEQPIKGARCYYLRYIAHDWSQEKNVQICTQICKAMEPGYSRLIINEWIVPESAPSKFMTVQDLNLMSVQGGMERTLLLHREYLEKAGLKITNIFWPGDTISEAVIEAGVA
ncbi:hypothetical protein H2204_006246 [Knufia peltigerae]|uniref:O-methyltransferase domain-containing protein n=1 Tax=Knufia peltigerae TaxID=1002370 RepID=A0AA38Y3Z0_9EURO|nr:hypothetical protein H2204_006246 [Knufia peltigerae]